MTTHRPLLTRRLKSLFASFGIVSALIGSPVVLVGTSAVAIFTPHSAFAAPTNELSSVPALLKKVLDVIAQGLITAADVGYKNALRTFLEKIAYDSAVFLASAGENQTPLISAKSIGEYVQSARDAAKGEFLNSLASKNGFINLNLCNLPTVQSVQLQIMLPKLLATEPVAPTCTLSEIKDSLADYADSFQEQWQLIMDDPSVFVNVAVAYDNGDNALSTLIDTWGEAIGAGEKAESEAKVERAKSDFQDLKEDISNYIKTPSNVIEFQTEASISQSTQTETTLTDNPVADALMVFTRTLTSKLMDRIGSGLITFFTTSDIASSLSGDSSTTAAGAGVAGAKQQYASFKTASFNSGGTFDILTQFAACPEQGADVTNCVINESLRLAIEEHLTVQQAIDQGLIDGATPFAFDPSNAGAPIEDPSTGIPFRSIEILKQYNVVPVGWVLAAQYMKDFGGDALTLQQLIDNYAKCDASDYSPYCGLVDPAWTLKAPAAYCKAEGYGETIANSQFEDLDGSEFTSEANLVSRLTSCLDAQTCLSEDSNGSCEAYGYCTQQEAIYQFQGESCPVYMASCSLYTDADNQKVSYLSNTLNYNDCSADNVGCQWYCTEYNTVDSAFQCSSQGMIYPTCTAESGCSCTVDAETCTIAFGGFQCSTASSAVCTGTPVADTTENIDSAISFDNDVTPCTNSGAGCTEFITQKGGANVLANASFEHFNSYHTVDIAALDELGAKADDSTTFPYDDTFGFYGTDGAGAPCTEDSGSQECAGWQLRDGVQVRAVNDAGDGSVALQFDGAGTGYISTVFETGSPLGGRTFILGYQYQNPASTDCDAEYWVRPDDGSTTPNAISQIYYSSGSFNSIDPQTWTFDSSVTTTAVRVGILSPAGCNLLIDAVKLEENSSATSYTAYGASADLTYVDMDEALICSPGDVGCQLYTPITGESDIPVPGIISNPLSAECGAGDDFSNPACSQCLEQFVGCEAYIPQQNAYSAPINTVAGFDDPTTLDATLAAGIAQRTGYYCDGTLTACSPERAELDCGSTAVACLPSVSIVPSTGTQCSVENVGCEEYVNIDAQSEGGEGLEYYSYIRQCVQPSDAQIAAGTIDTFYTFEGSDITGYQIRSWYLKASNVDGGPCTNLDLFGDSAQTTSADCIDTSTTQQSCSADDITTNPDCTEYYDSAGGVYYRLASTTITVSDSCQAMRNSLDQRLYYTIPSESTSCPAAANLCQEFQGSEGEAARAIVEESFDSGVWTDGESSSTVITASTGQSMAIGAGTTNGFTSAYTDVSTLLDTDTNYVVTFWAKASEENVTLTPYFSSGTTISPFNTSATLSTDWKRFQMGPAALATLNGDEQFGFASTSSTSSTSYIVYIDTVTLTESNSYFLIAGSADLCTGYGCEEYLDSTSETHYLKSFTKLCDENDVGCQTVIATHNSENPFYQNYNGENEYTEDDVAVVQDEVMNVVVNDGVLCQSLDASCTAVGIPDLDENENVESLSTTYILNDPDAYDTILCQEQQRSCQQYSDSSGTTVYFKNPGDKYCTYNSADGEWQKPDGSACPVQNSSTAAEPSQPKGAICNAGVRVGELCTSDAQCPNEDGVTLSRCVSNADENSGWVGRCEDAYNGCTLYVDPNPKTEIDNAQFETDIKDNTDITSTEPDGVPDEWDENLELSSYYLRDFFSEGGLSSGSTVGCSIFASAVSPVFDRDTSVQLQAGTTDSAWCIVNTSDFITIRRDSTYTLSGHVYLEDATDRFAIGLLYYDADGNEILFKDSARTTVLTTEDHAFAAYAGGSRSSETLPTGEWMRFSAVIGPNIAHEFPEDAYYAQVFLETRETGADSSVYFDAIQFGEDQEYTYIANTVDGSSSSDLNSCNGTVDIANGCVAFRDTTSADLTTLSVINSETAVNTDFTTNPCTFNSGVASESCDGAMNVADSNVVLKVENDRQCSQWLTCIYSRPNYDESGNLISTTCLQVGECTKRNPDTGQCLELASVRAASSLGYDDDLSAISQPGNTDSLIDISMLSGYSTVGAEWTGVCSESNVCVGGANDGNACSVNEDCADAQNAYGYYSPAVMPQQGAAGASSTEDIVSDGDFEEVYCVGETLFNVDDIGLTDQRDDHVGESLTEEFSTLDNARDKKLKCTLDTMCRTTNTESKVESILDTAELSKDVETIPYSEGWCENVDTESQAWNDWSTVGDAEMSIIDYQSNGVEGAPYTPATSDIAIIQTDRYASAYGSGRLDLNNVMLVAPKDNAESGVRANLGNVISNGNSYVVSFDAQYMSTPSDNDFIQVGLVHGDDPENIDYFEQGTSMADIVFVVDASGSMSDYIANVASATSALVSGLQDAGVNYQTAIVTTGGGRVPRVLDFDDYTSGSGADYGEADGVTVDFTNDATEFAAAMNYISGDLDGGSAFNYEALVDVAAGVVDEHTLNFRSGAQKFVILLTDVRPESGDDHIVNGTSSSSWDEDDETALIETIDGTPYVLYTITETDVANAYNQLVEQYGGEQFDISSSNYSGILSNVSSAMTDLVSEFKFSNSYQRYTLGPIQVSHKIDQNDDTYLVIRQVAGSENLLFVVDDVSLLPALEVNKENNPASENSTWLISRECRGYPEDSSTECNYKDTSGTFYQGWKGYCLRHDQDVTSTPDIDESQRCIAWWPVDTIAGEPDNVSRDTVAYSSLYPVYSCLVAKGNASISVCAETTNGTRDGLLCTTDADCGGDAGICVGDGDEITEQARYFNGRESDAYDLNSAYTIANYTMSHRFVDFRLDTEDAHINSTGISAPGDHEYAFFHRFDVADGDLPVEGSINISEIDDLHYFLGDLTINSDGLGSGVSDENVTSAQNTWYAGPNDLNLRSDLQTQSSKMFLQHTQLLQEEGETDTVDENWNFQCANRTTDPDCMPVYSYQKAAWCGSSPCDAESTQDEWKDVDFTFVKAIMPKTEDATLDQYIDSYLSQEVDPFVSLDDISAGSAIWTANDGEGTAGQIRNSNFVGSHQFGTFFQSEETENSAFSRLPESATFDPSNDSCFGSGGDTSCGANIVGVKFDFEQGHLKYVYVFYWAGMRNTDFAHVENAYWEIGLREPCLLAVQSVSEEAITTPWMTRTTSTSSYAIPGTGVEFSSEPTNDVYGAIGMDSPSTVGPVDCEDTLEGNCGSIPNAEGSTTLLDGFGGTEGVVPSWVSGNFDNVTTSAGNLPYASPIASIGQGLPLACIGNCGVSVCNGTDGTGFGLNGEELANEYHEETVSSCFNGTIGVPLGVCSESGNLCNDALTDCSGTGETCEPMDVSNKGAGEATYYDQLQAAAAVAWQRYRLLFPTLGSNGAAPTRLSQSSIFYAPLSSFATPGQVFQYVPQLLQNTTTDSSISDAFDQDGDTIFDFEDMSECTGARDENDYCYVQPEVSNIIVNYGTSGDITVPSGTFVSLQFDSAVNADQEPLQNINIEWLGIIDSPTFNSSGTVITEPWAAAATIGHSYAYAYTCDPANHDYWDNDAQACAYQLRVQIQDNWGFCSGETSITRTRTYSGGDACTSYDTYAGTIYVKP
ncbi:MAG: hypothetical protein KIH62_001340 [Candidatus Kerfeldbacteria bacterium]|nr:hypothetical protein [Candidatus Kerfeldbacteria bacterium]